MRYGKPLVVDLSAGARAAGQGPLGCYNGDGANGWSEVCYTGTGPRYSIPPCRTGNRPPAVGDCIGGSSAFCCESGASGSNDPNGCRSGPLVD